MRDTGPGISPAQQERLFDSFSQADASTTRRYGGSGLGLTISKQPTELMGGEIGVESALGAGATFWFTAKLERRPEASLPVRGISSGQTLQGLRVLAVDDTSANRTILEDTLRAWGMHPDSAPDGARALTVLKEASAKCEPYHLALLDQHMRDMTGVELADG